MKSLTVSAFVFVFILAVAGAAGAQTDTDDGAVKDASRNLPGWECPHHPLLKSFTPVICPICRQMGKGFLPYIRTGESTCSEHPEVSSKSEGRCPLCEKELIRVEELEKQTGKTIAEIDEALGVAAKKDWEEQRQRKIVSQKAKKVAEVEGVERVEGVEGEAKSGGMVWVISLGILVLLVLLALATLFVQKNRKKKTSR